MKGEIPSAMKLKIDPVVEVERKSEDFSVSDGSQVAEQPVHVTVSPKTEPIIPPEIWAMICEGLPSTDLVTVINTCPEWNKLLSSKKPSFLFPKGLSHMRGWLPKNDLLSFRLINKACKVGVDVAHPENLPCIAKRQEEIRGIEARMHHIQDLIQLEERFIAHGNNRAYADRRETNLWQLKRSLINSHLTILRNELQFLQNLLA